MEDFLIAGCRMDGETPETEKELSFAPYFAWSNWGQVKVWLPVGEMNDEIPSLE